MATYVELFDLRSDDALRNKIAVACVVKAADLIDGATPTTAEITWANEAIQSPLSKAEAIMNYVLAANKAGTVAQIQGASDSAIQANVDTAVDALIAGGV